MPRRLGRLAVSTENSVWLVGPGSDDDSPYKEALEGLGFAPYSVDPSILQNVVWLGEAMKRSPPRAVLVASSGSKSLAIEEFAPLRATAGRQGVPILGIVDPSSVPLEYLARFDDWVSEANLAELPTRIECCQEKLSLGGSVQVGTRLLMLVIHDLRNPLNVIYLTQRVMEQSIARRDFDLGEDMVYLRQNAAQMDRILAMLGDYCDLIEPSVTSPSYEVDPRRFVEEVLDDKVWQGPSRLSERRVEVDPSCPASVRLDLSGAKLALLHALDNAASAGGEVPLIIKLWGDAQTWSISIQVDRPPPRTLKSFEVEPRNFVRFRGIAGERNGFDLALAARILKMSGGKIEFEVVPEKRTAITLTWPIEIESKSENALEPERSKGASVSSVGR